MVQPIITFIVFIILVYLMYKVLLNFCNLLGQLFSERRKYHDQK